MIAIPCLTAALALAAPPPHASSLFAPTSFVHQAATAAVQDFAAEYEALETAQQEAEAAWYKTYRAAPEDQRTALFNDRRKLQSEYFAKYEGLALRAKGTEVGAKSNVKVVQLGLQDDDEEIQARVEFAVDELLARYIDSKALKDLAGMLGYAQRTLGEEYCRKSLKQLLEKSPHREVQAPALFGLASQALESAKGDADQIAYARKLFERLGASYADVIQYGSKTYGATAAGTLYELDHLQVGMVAPDMETTDENGAKFKLSDYRGKVVVVDFWGFW